jgi:hypothetical protein
MNYWASARTLHRRRSRRLTGRRRKSITLTPAAMKATRRSSRRSTRRTMFYQMKKRGRSTISSEKKV